jgi:2-oxoisovalerate dehydrogenase E2 component (dihydrolipoyl transacylase)
VPASARFQLRAPDSESSGANLIGYGTSEPKTRSAKKRSFGQKTFASPRLRRALRLRPRRRTLRSSAATPPATDEPAGHHQHQPQRCRIRHDRVRRNRGRRSLPRVLTARAQAREGSRNQRQTSARHRPRRGRDQGRCACRESARHPIRGARCHCAYVPAGTSPANRTAPGHGTGSRLGERFRIRNSRLGEGARLPRRCLSSEFPSGRPRYPHPDHGPAEGRVRTPDTKSRQEIPEATIWLDVDATELLNTKRALEARTGEKYSLLSLVARFVVAGLKKYPIINSSIDTAAGEIVTHGDINLGLAAQTPRGLMVPVVHGADQMSLRQLRDSVSETVGKAATGKFDPSELSGGTFTLNNYGVFGVDGSAPIINLPEVAMLGLGRIKDRPWVVDGAADGAQGDVPVLRLRPPGVRRPGAERVPHLRRRLHREPDLTAPRALTTSIPPRSSGSASVDRPTFRQTRAALNDDCTGGPTAPESRMAIVTTSHSLRTS